MNVAVLPRINEDRRKTIIAAAASAAFHILIILCVALFFVRQQQSEVAIEETPMELTILPSDPPKVQPTYVATDPSQQADSPPKNADFESDNDTHAASELPASGSTPLPSVDGEQGLSLELANRQYTAGREPRPSTPAQQQPQQQAADETAPKTEATPQVVPKAPAELALLEQPKPKPAEAVPKQAQPKPKTEAPSVPGYQPETRVTRIRGNISNRGKAAVAAEATPLGRYKKMLSDAIGSRWYYYVNDQMGLLNIGTVNIRFIVRQDGRVEGLQVLSNSSNESFAACSVSSIVEAEIPPIPDEVARMLDNGRIEIDYTFTIINN